MKFSPLFNFLILKSLLGRETKFNIFNGDLFHKFFEVSDQEVARDQWDFSSPHQSAMNKAIVPVMRLSEAMLTRSSKACISRETGP